MKSGGGEVGKTSRFPSRKRNEIGGGGEVGKTSRFPRFLLGFPHVPPPSISFCILQSCNCCCFWDGGKKRNEIGGGGR